MVLKRDEDKLEKKLEIDEPYHKESAYMAYNSPYWITVFMYCKFVMICEKPQGFMYI